jgi:hypothetical protein
MQVVGGGAISAEGESLGRHALAAVRHLDVRVDNGDVKVEAVALCKFTAKSEIVFGTFLCGVDVGLKVFATAKVLESSAGIHLGGFRTIPVI